MKSAVMSSLLSLVVVVSASAADASTVTKKVYRSRSGGSATSDTVTVKVTAPADQKESDLKAMPSTKIFEKEESKGSRTRKVYLSHTGGSAGAQYVAVPK